MKLIAGHEPKHGLKPGRAQHVLQRLPAGGPQTPLEIQPRATEQRGMGTGKPAPEHQHLPRLDNQLPQRHG